VLDATSTHAAVSTRRPTLGPSSDIEQVFAQYLDPVYRFLYRRLGNREDAEDLTSEVFLKAARGLDQTRSQASIAQWLFTVARTVLADHWRRYYRGGAPLPLDDARVGEMPGRVESNEPSQGTTALVERVLEALPERYRNVLELRFLRGYSVQETAQELELSVENVKVIQHRALAKAVQITEGWL
jgi:RNA polymerase sigma-70 factor (ECF subfamily)